MKEYAAQAGIPQDRIDEAIKYVQEGWDDIKIQKYFDSIGAAHRANQPNPHQDYSDATLKQRMAQQVAGKDDAQLKKEADEIAAEILKRG